MTEPEMRTPDEWCLHRAEAAEAELAASERWRHDTAVERDYEVGRRIAAEARIAELEADITVIDDLASGDRAQMRARIRALEAELADCKIEGLDQ